jgi:hypothetical protein
MGFWAEISNHLGYSNGLKNSSCLGLAQTIGKIFYFRNILLTMRENEIILILEAHHGMFKLASFLIMVVFFSLQIIKDIL